MSDRDQSSLNLAQDFSRGNDLFVMNFDEESARFGSARFGTAVKIKNAFVEGFTCFLFRFKFHARSFEWRVALPPAAGFDEQDAWDMGQEAFDRFLVTVAKLAAQEKTGKVEYINADKPDEPIA